VQKAAGLLQRLFFHLARQIGIADKMGASVTHAVGGYWAGHWPVMNRTNNAGRIIDSP
jgi:hypothetical protein